MCVAPEKFFFIFFGIDVFVTNIDSANKSDNSVNNDYFSVVAIVDPVCKANKLYFIKRKCLYASFQQPGNLFFTDVPASEVIINKSYFYAFFCFLDQKVDYFASNCIGIENVIFYVDVVFCVFYGLKNLWEFKLSILEQEHFVVCGDWAQRLVEDQRGELLIIFHRFLSGGKDGFGICSDLFYKPFLFGSIEDFLAVDLSFAIIDAYGKIDYHSYERQKNDSQQIGQSLGCALGIVNNPNTNNYY